jgi:hypothetical protein
MKPSPPPPYLADFYVPYILSYEKNYIFIDADLIRDILYMYLFFLNFSFLALIIGMNEMHILMVFFSSLK